MLTGFFGDPLFATNDDVGLAMIGAGVGMAAHPEPHVIFSHYGYGLLLNGLSHIVGAKAHGFLSLFAVGSSFGLFAYTIGRRLEPLIISLSVAGGCIYVAAFLTPQFTVTAGVLVAAGFASYLAASQCGEISRGRLACIYFAVVLGGLIRPASALAVLIICAPALIWIAFKGTHVQRQETRSLIIFLAIIGVMAYGLDWAAYHFSNDWTDALEYNLVRALFNDFSRVPWVPEAPAYNAAGWSRNDYLKDALPGIGCFC
jgi:hypothetical protein